MPTTAASTSTSAVGSANLTAQYYGTNRDAWVLDTNPTDVAAIVATFDTDYAAPPSGRPPEGSPAANLVWSPDARATFLRHIDQATHSVDVTSEELEDRAVLSALGKAARRGVSCRIVLTSNRPALTRSPNYPTPAARCICCRPPTLGCTCTRRCC